MITCGQCRRQFHDKGDFYSEKLHPCFQGIYRAFGWILVKGVNDKGLHV